MMSDVVATLQDASWPVLLVDEHGLIQNANAFALGALLPTLENGVSSLSLIWQEDDPLTPSQFLNNWEHTRATPVRLNLRNPNGGKLSYHACVCLLPEDGRKNYLLQLLPGNPAVEASKNNSMDASTAHKQKLDCALQLARTVSLDFNNALTSILGHTSLVLSKLEPNSPWQHSLKEVEKSAGKAAEIANDLGAFSLNEKETRVQQSGNLNQILQRNAETFQALKSEKDISWSLQLERRLHTAKFDEAKMQQALMKLIENAIESLGPRGRVILTTKNLTLTEPTQDRNAQLAAGEYICAEITDNGCGIDTEVLPRIFEPFFTTKRASKHRGLGLTWVYGIVTNHGGVVAVSSQPTLGTSVRVYLPADNKFVADNPVGAQELHGNGTILMVDDEDLLLTMGEAILSSYGYRVLTANGGAKALDLISKSDRQIDLLITDLVMPSMSGRELVEQVRVISPFTRVLCTSGYVRSSMEEQRGAAYLQKPFTSQELLLKVKQALALEETAHVD